MTNEKASVIIGNIPVYGDECYSIAEYQEAKAMSIQALLQVPKTGHWIIISVDARGVLMKCDKCERLVCTESPESYTYCPSCGEKMVEREKQG